MAPPILTSPPTNESSDVLGPYPTLILAADGNKTIPIGPGAVGHTVVCCWRPAGLAQDATLAHTGAGVHHTSRRSLPPAPRSHAASLLLLTATWACCKPAGIQWRAS